LAIRVVAVATLALLLLYHAMRFAATGCNGSVCDTYTALSVLLPVLVWIGALVSGVSATVSARSDRGAWPLVLLLCTAASVIGPIAGLVLLRDSPDAFVVSSTVLLLLAPASALFYSFIGKGD
jgi:hypothetical protein